MYENKAKNGFQVGEFKEFFFREHDVLEQFLRIFHVEIEEEQIFVYFTVNRILSHFIVHLSFFLKVHLS